MISVLFPVVRVCESAVLVAVAEIDEAAERTPDDEADPGLPGQVIHEVAAGQDSERRDEPDERAAEGARHLRLRDAQDENADGGNQESVPILAISAMMPMGTKPAMIETKMPPMTVTMYGVW
mgnify:CR=1 FL=1